MFVWFNIKKDTKMDYFCGVNNNTKKRIGGLDKKLNFKQLPRLVHVGQNF